MGCVLVRYRKQAKTNHILTLFFSLLFLCCVSSMSTSSSDQKTPVDYGVQIRFINDICDTGGMQPGSQPKTRTQTTSKYGVAVRVQGIAGQPYVVLKDGQKGDSYGVQLRTQYPSGYSSLPRRREKAEPGTQGADVGGGGGQGGALRRAQSHGSLLDRDGEGGAGKEDFQLSRPPGDGKSGSYGNLDGGIGVRGERELVWGVGGREGDMERNVWDGSYKAGLNGSVRSSQAYPDRPQQTNERPSNQRQTPVNRLINRFDGGNTGGQQRGLPPAQEEPRATSPLLTPSPYTSPPSSTHSSLGRSQSTVTTFPGHSVNQSTSPGRYAAVETPQASLTEVRTKCLMAEYSSCFSVSSERSMQHCKSSFLIYVSR